MNSRFSIAGRSLSATNLFTRQSLWIWPIVAAILLAGVGFLIRGVVEKAVMQSMENNLQTILDADVEALKIWLSAQETNAMAIASQKNVRELATKLVALDAEGKGAADTLRGAPELEQLRHELRPWLEVHQEYVGFGLISLQGRIIAGKRSEAIGRTDLPFQPSSLEMASQGEATVSRTFKSFMLIETPDGPAMAGVATMFVIAPVRDEEGNVIATLGFRIRPEEEFTKILSVARAGESGETYAFDEKGVLLSQSRFDDELKAIGLLTDDELTSSILNLSIRDPEVNMAEGDRPSLRRAEQSLTRSVADAVTGNSGIDVTGYRDYRGSPVIGAWTWLPKYGFGVVTEVDISEAFRPLYVLRYAFWGLFLLLGLSSIVIFVFTILMARLNRKARQTALKAQRLGQYQLDKQIGAGGMGVVYRGHHDMLQRPTAIKLLNVENTTSETISRFEREVQMTSQLNHPNTITVFDYGRTPEGIFYYAMEYLDGLPLDDLVKQHGPLPEGRVIHLLRQVCGSLREAHGVGLIHRDIKPANIIVGQRGGISDFLKLLDFGLVKAVDAEHEAGLTADGSLTGTPHYLAPEAIENPATVDARSDLYAVGAVGYFLLTGTPVFEGESIVEICMQHVQKTPVRPSERLGQPISADLETLLLKCLAKKQADRVQSADELDAELARCAAVCEWTSVDAKAWWDNLSAAPKQEKPSMPTASGGDSPTVMLDQPPTA